MPSSTHTVKIANVSKVKKYYDLLPGGVDNEKITAVDLQAIINEIFHRRVYNFQRTNFIQQGLDHTWQCDLLDVSKVSRSNSNVNFLLVVIDCFSKFLMCRALKNKKSLTVVTAMNDIIEQRGRAPMRLQNDKGREFLNQDFRALLVKYDIKQYYTYTILKSSIVERVNRTLRSLIARYQQTRGTATYVNHLQSLVNAYNRRKHRTIKMAPEDVNQSNEKLIMKKFYSTNNNKRCENPKFKIGEAVRLFTMRQTFSKENSGSYTHEIFYVSQINEHTSPCTYSLINTNRERIQGRVYNEEIIKVRRPSLYIINSILDKRNGQSLIRLEGMSKDEDLWINNEDIHVIKYDDN